MASALQSVNNIDLRDRINTIISEYKQLIDKSYLSLKYFTKNECFHLMKRICEEISPATLSLIESDTSNKDNEQNLENNVHISECDLSQNRGMLSQIEHTPQEMTKNYEQLVKDYVHLSQGLLKENEQLLQIIATQQQHEINRNESSTKTINDSQIMSETQQNQRNRLVTDIIMILAATILILATIITLWRYK